MKIDYVGAGTNIRWLALGGELVQVWAIGSTEDGRLLCRLRSSGRQMTVSTDDVVSESALLGRLGCPTVAEAQAIARCSTESVDRARREAQAELDGRRDAHSMAAS